MELVFFGNAVNAETLEGLLRTAVVHTPACTNLDLMYDPDAWAGWLLGDLAGTPLMERVGEVLTDMARTGSAAELRFAAKHDNGRDLIPPAVLLDALDRAADAETRAYLVGSLRRALNAGRLAYSTRLRAVIGDANVQHEVLGAIALHDHAEFLASLEKIFGTDPAAAKLRAAYAVSGLNEAEVMRLREEIAGSALRDDVRAAILVALDDMLAHPSMKKLAGHVRW
jgi:hypothetical protein